MKPGAKRAKRQSTPDQKPLTIQDTSPRVQQRPKIKRPLKIASLDWTPKQKQLIDLLLNKETRMVFIKGPPGSTKTSVCMWVSLQLLNSGTVKELTLVRTMVESSESGGMGFLPGDKDAKFGPYMRPFLDKLELFLPADDVKFLHTDNRLLPCPVNHMRGTEHNVRAIIVDEAQNFTFKDINTTITRTGKFSKVMVCADVEQIDLPDGKSGFEDTWDEFSKEEYRKDGIYCFEFGEEDIMRDHLVRVIVSAMRKVKAARAAKKLVKR